MSVGDTQKLGAEYRPRMTGAVTDQGRFVVLALPRLRWRLATASSTAHDPRGGHPKPLGNPARRWRLSRRHWGRCAGDLKSGSIRPNHRQTDAQVRPRGHVATHGRSPPDQHGRRREWARWATGRCDDGWVPRISSIGEVDAVLAAVDGLLGQCVPERSLKCVLAGNVSTAADS